MESAEPGGCPLTSPEPPGDPDRIRRLIASLEALLRDLGRLPIAEAERGVEGPAIEIWADPDHIYAEARLVGAMGRAAGLDPDRDVNLFIGHGKVFLRVER